MQHQKHQKKPLSFEIFSRIWRGHRLQTHGLLDLTVDRGRRKHRRGAKQQYVSF